MEITVTTAEKSLTKSLVNQMRHASLEVIQEGDVLGFVINVVKDCDKAVLMSYKEDYYTVPTDYKRKDKVVFRKVGSKTTSIFKGPTKTRTIDFQYRSHCTNWWKAYQEVLKKAIHHIYV